MDPIFDFSITLATVPNWMLPFTTAAKGCLQRIFVTMKLKASRSTYLAFAGDVVSMLSPSQWKCLGFVFCNFSFSC